MKALQTLIVCAMLISIIAGCAGCSKIADYRKEAYFAKGKQFYESGDYDGALKEFANALVFDAKYFDALYLSGMCWYQRKAYLEAVPYFDRALQERSDNSALYVLLAESYLMANRFGPARAQCERGLEIDPGNVALQYLLVKTQIRSRRLPRVTEATEIIHALLNSGRQDSWLFILQAETMILQGRTDQAMELLTRPGLDEHPDWQEVMVFFAESLRKDRVYDRYNEVVNSLIQHSDDPYPYLRELALFYQETGDADKEEAMLRRCVALQGAATDIKYLIDFLVRQKRIPDARAVLAAELERDPDSHMLAATHAQLYLQEGEHAAAIEFLNNRLTTASASPEETADSMVLLAEAHLAIGNLVMSESILRTVLRERPSNSQALFVLAKISLQRGDYLNAVGSLRRLSAMNPGTPEYYYYLGLAHLGREEKFMAQKAFLDALEAYPVYKPALVQFAELSAAAGAYSELKVRIRRYLESNPGDQEIIELRKTLP